MSRREATHRSSLSHSLYQHEAVPQKSLDGQYPHDRNSTGLNKEYEAEEARQVRQRHEAHQCYCQKKKVLQDGRTAYISFVETHDARANIDPGERHWKARHCCSGYTQGEDESRQCPLPRSTSFHSKDKDVLFESPAFSNDLARRPLNPYDTSPSESHRKPVPYDQPSTRGEASSPFPRLVQSASPQPGLTRTDTYMSTGSDHSFSDIELDDPLGEDYEGYELVSKKVKVPGHCRNGSRHTFS